MHIMQLISGHGNMNGAMVHCVQLCERLAQQGHRITLVCRENSQVREYVTDMPIEVVLSAQHRIPTDELRRIATIVKQEQVDLIHAHMSRAQFFGVLLKHMTGVPCVATAHCQAIKAHRMFNDFVISNSEANRRTQMRKNFVRSSRIETVYCPIDLAGHKPLAALERSAVRESLGASEETKLLGIIGSVCQRKGHDLLLRALPAVLHKFPQVRVAMVGGPHPDYSAECLRLAKQLAVDHAVVWTGFRKDIPQVMSALDLCIVPSRSEPFGLTAVEALAAGTPVIAARVGGLPESVDHEHTGLLIKPNRPKELAEAILRLLSDAELYEQCSQAARPAMLQRYDAERLWTRIEEILVSVAGRRAQRRAA